MIFLLALIGFITLAVLFWRAFGVDEETTAPGRTIGPDDDPDFLRRIDPGASRGQSGDADDGPTPV